MQDAFNNSKLSEQNEGCPPLLQQISNLCLMQQLSESQGVFSDYIFKPSQPLLVPYTTKQSIAKPFPFTAEVLQN